MTASPSNFFLVALAMMMASCGPSHAQTDMSPSSALQMLSLNRANDGQKVVTTVGQSIEITLQTIDPGQYGNPRISSPAIRFESAAFSEDLPNPDGVKQVYRFHTVAEGEARVHIPHTASNPTFKVRIHVAAWATELPTTATSDQAKAAQGNNAFAIELYRQLRNQSGNLFFSPESISTVLAMTYAGARVVRSRRWRFLTRTRASR